MSEIKKRMEEHTEELTSICHQLTQSLKKYIDAGIEHANTHEVGAVADMIKDLSEAKEKTIKSFYYIELLEKMEGAEYGTDYNEDGPIWEGRQIKNPYTEAMEHFMESEDMEERRERLGDYIRALTADIMKMLQEMDMEEKQILKDKLQIIQNKI